MAVLLKKGLEKYLKFGIDIARNCDDIVLQATIHSPNTLFIPTHLIVAAPATARQSIPLKRSIIAMLDLVAFTLVYELIPSTGWTGYVRELPLLGQVQHARLSEVQHQLSLQLVDIVRAMPHKEDIRISSEFYYRCSPGNQQT